jgi:3-oxoacyl-[acyl-carrier protein] reductase
MSGTVNGQYDLSGQVALVTGAGRGIGRAIAVGYGAAGASVVLAARTEGQIRQASEEIEAAGGTALPLVVDVTDPSALARSVDTTIREFGRLDLVVANAGAIAPAEPCDGIADFAYVLDVNLVSVHTLARLAEPHLRVRGGKFVVIGSGGGRRPLPGGVAYSVSKAGASMLVRALAVEWRTAPIAVNEIIPGPVRTEMAANTFGHLTGVPDAMRLEWMKEPGDVVPLALFLAGLPDDGPTGQTFSLLGRDM